MANAIPQRNTPEFKAKRAAAERQRRAALKAQGISAKTGKPTFEAKQGVSYYERGSIYETEEQKAQARRDAVKRHRSKIPLVCDTHTPEDEEYRQYSKRVGWYFNAAKILFHSPEEKQEWVHRYITATHCELSGVEFGTGSRKKCIDHCHTTHRPRGIICHGVNVAIGHLETFCLPGSKVDAYLQQD